MDGLRYWVHICTLLENKYGVTLLKEGKTNIKFVKAGEYGIPGHEVSIYAQKVGEYLQIRGKDGIVWFTCDASWNFFGGETETNHPREGLRDMKAVFEPFMNDMREDPCTMTDMKRIMAQSYSQTEQQLSRLAEHITQEQKKALIQDIKQQAINEARQELKEEMAPKMKPLDRWDAQIYG